MPHKEKNSFCPPANVVREFCLEELYPQFLFRYMAPREPPTSGAELELCTLAYVRSPSSFALQLDMDRRISDRLSYQLAKLYEKPDKRTECTLMDELLHEGIPVAARYMVSDDLRWYRGIVVGIDKTPGKENPISIRFVDYGNFQQNDRRQLMLMPVDMGNEPPLAIKCRLKGTSEGDKFSPEVEENFRQFHSSVLKECRCFVTFCSFDAAANQYVVRLYNSVDGEEYLLPHGATPLFEPTVDGVVDDLINLELETRGGDTPHVNGVADEGPSGSSTTPKPNRAVRSPMDDLEDLFPPAGDAAINGDLNAVSASVATSSGADMPRVGRSDQYAQTDVTMDQQGIFSDPEFKELMDKYPNLVAYLKYPF